MPKIKQNAIYFCTSLILMTDNKQLKQNEYKIFETK